MTWSFHHFLLFGRSLGRYLQLGQGLVGGIVAPPIGGRATVEPKRWHPAGFGPFGPTLQDLGYVLQEVKGVKSMAHRVEEFRGSPTSSSGAEC